MAITIQNVVDDARASLNDDDKTRWSDAECLEYAKAALDAIFQLRPDLFIGQFEPLFDSEALALTSNFPIEERYRRQVADYIVMRAETKDDEAVVTQRAAGAFKYFTEMLLG
jgi:hypothetical protein